eukprot:SM000015S01303  [mRNA]  locus=s15:1135354:1140300:+ [translate_table: standard]
MVASVLGLKGGWRRKSDGLPRTAKTKLGGVFAMKDTITKAEARDMAAAVGATPSLIKDYFHRQRDRVRRELQLAQEAAPAARHLPLGTDGSALPATAAAADTVAKPSAGDPGFLGRLMAETTVGGQTALLLAIAVEEDRKALRRLVSSGCLLVLAAWLAAARREEQTTLLRALLKARPASTNAALARLPVGAAPARQLWPLAKGLAKLAGYGPAPDVGHAAARLVLRWDKLRHGDLLINRPMFRQTLERTVATAAIPLDSVAVSSGSAGGGHGRGPDALAPLGALANPTDIAATPGLLRPALGGGAAVAPVPLDAGLTGEYGPPPCTFQSSFTPRAAAPASACAGLNASPPVKRTSSSLLATKNQKQKRTMQRMEDANGQGTEDKLLPSWRSSKQAGTRLRPTSADDVRKAKLQAGNMQGRQSAVLSSANLGANNGFYEAKAASRQLPAPSGGTNEAVVPDSRRHGLPVEPKSVSQTDAEGGLSGTQRGAALANWVTDEEKFAPAVRVSYDEVRQAGQAVAGDTKQAGVEEGDKCEQDDDGGPAASVPAQSVPVPPHVEWSLPQEMPCCSDWEVAAGEDSTERAVQQQRDQLSAPAVYRAASDVPPSPHEPWEPQGTPDDASVPLISLAQAGDHEQLASVDPALHTLPSNNAKEMGFVDAAYNHGSPVGVLSASNKQPPPASATASAASHYAWEPALELAHDHSRPTMGAAAAHHQLTGQRTGKSLLLHSH